MTDQQPQERDRLVRRTTGARRGVVAAGTVGALGAAVAVGVSTPSGGDPTSPAASPAAPAAPATSSRRGAEATRAATDARVPQQLASPGGSGPAQGTTGGS